MEKRGLTFTPRQIILAAAVLVLVLVVATCRWQAAEERRRAEEIATAQGLAQVITATFAGRTDLKISNLSGTIDVTSVDRGPIFRSEQRATLPFSVDYFVDLSKVDLTDTRYNPGSRTLTIEVPPVRIADPNIDLTKGKVGEAEGFWVSRRAGSDLIRRGLVLTRAQAAKTAAKPENVQRAREEARQRIGALLELPLKAAGHEGVRIAVRFPTDGAEDPSYLDSSVTYNEAIAEARRRRAGEKTQ
jgi:hypothetical protein